MNLKYIEYATKRLKLFIQATDEGITAIHFDKKGELTNGNAHTVACTKQLDEYFAGKRKKFELKLNPIGTEFQKKAWKALESIPFGKTFSYQEQAIKVGNKNYTRAVGGANNKNPIPIIIPCHRVIGKNGDLTGYAGGIEFKKYLLSLEKK